MTGRGETRDDVIASFYRAAFAHDHWPEALALLRRHFGGAAGVVYVHDTQTGAVPLWLSVGTEGGDNDYRRDVKDINPRASFAMAQRPGTLIWDYQVLPEAGMQRHPFYDWLKRVHGFRYFVGCRMFEIGTCSAFASVEFSTSHGHVDTEKIERFRNILPHLEEAVRLTLANRNVATRTGAMETIVNMFQCGVALLDRGGHVVYVNAKTDVLLAQDDGISVRDRMLCVSRSSDMRMLAHMIRTTLDGQGDGAVPVTTAIPRISGAGPYYVTVAPVSVEPFAMLAGEAAAIVLIRGNEISEPAFDRVGQIYGLSARETEITAALQRGLDLREASTELGISFNTARAHLRSVFRKTGSRSQAELARTVSKLVD